jgi:YHS domain-containing protein
MANLNDLEQRIQEKLARSEEERRLRRNHLENHMSEMEQRLHRYPAVADHLIQEIIRPRLEQVEKSFQALNPPQWECTRHTCKLIFKHCPRFPATAAIEFGLTRDGEARTVRVDCRETVLPLFFPVKGEDQLVLPFESIDDEKVAAWVDAKLLQFVDDYLRLEATDPYQAENVVTDPVCNMSINKLQAGAEMDHEGTRYYFCVEECRKKFAEDPARYLTRVTVAVPV